jgi:hypothetical protein
MTDLQTHAFTLEFALRLPAREGNLSTSVTLAEKLSRFSNVRDEIKNPARIRSRAGSQDLVLLMRLCVQSFPCPYFGRRTTRSSPD